MHPAKRFFYVSLGILALAGAFHLGARSARGQGFGTIVGITLLGGSQPVAVASNGDVYCCMNFNWQQLPWQFTHVGNVFGAGPIQTVPSTLGQLKAKYR